VFWSLTRRLKGFAAWLTNDYSPSSDLLTLFPQVRINSMWANVLLLMLRSCNYASCRTKEL